MKTKVQGIKFEVKDYSHHILDKAIEVANDFRATPLQIEVQMRKLYLYPYINSQVIETYNKLEKKWKILTNYRTNDNRAVSWQE